ncbi:lipopolysaccharide biosynthesis protein [Pseudidiomarina aestuarii]|uniref:lipopolysaccharide biosynthesis protein n=1 Tax=Pseudidiomarina aestuarii TaxID=624146 RepID=UPI003A96E1E4
MIKFKALKGDFAKNIFTLMTGSTIAQAIPLAVSPILTRLYSPEEFGLLALFIAITSIFGAIANGRYELAIMLPADDEDAVNIAALGLIITTTLAFLLLILVFFLNQHICNWLGNEAIGVWLYFVPFVVWFTGLYNVLNYFNNRIKNYKDIAYSTICKSIASAFFQLFLGYIKLGAAGLISGQVFATIIANGTLLKRTLNYLDVRKVISVERIKFMAIRYRQFPAYSMFGILANALAQNLTSILISTYYSVATLGFYSLVQRILGMPSALVGGAVGQVFYQKAIEEKNRTGKADKVFDSTVKGLVLLALPAFLILYLFIEDLFAFVFGEKWRVAGEYAEILTPLFFVKFVMSAVSNINNVFEKQRIALVWQFIFLVLSLGVFIISKNIGFSEYYFFRAMTIVLFLHYVFLYFIMREVSKGNL